MARSVSGRVAIRYVLPVVWMTSRLAVVGRIAMRWDIGAEWMSMNALLEIALIAPVVAIYIQVNIVLFL